MFSPADPAFRWLFLFFLCFMTFGSYWSYDIPAAIENYLIQRFNSSTLYSLLYTVYNFTNIVVVLFGGYFIDRIGLRIGSLLFCALIALGQVVVSFGVSLHDNDQAFAVMLAGRLIFSLGGESLSVAQSTFCSKWFKGKELALSFGITLSFSRIGSFTNLNVTPIIARDRGVPFAVWFGTLTCLISLAMTFLISVSDKVRDKQIQAKADPAAPPSVPFRPQDIRHFPLSLWLIYFICVLYYSGIFTLISISGVSYMFGTFGYDQTRANRYLSVPYIMSAVLAPICGGSVDKVGRKPLWLTMTSGLLVLVYVILIWFPNMHLHFFEEHSRFVPLLAMALMGVSYSLCAASLWPCVPLLVPEDRVGTAYGVMNSIQNGGLSIVSVVVGWQFQSCSENKYHLGSQDCSSDLSCSKHCSYGPLYLLLGTSVVSTVFCVFLMLEDARKGNILGRKGEDTPAAIIAETEPLLTNSDKEVYTTYG